MVQAVKLKLTIAYDGSNYAGWQVQKTGIGIQQKIEEVLARFFPSASRLSGSSRTDTGVHALGMIAHVEIAAKELKMPMAKIHLALNAFLPEWIPLQNVPGHCRDARADRAGQIRAK